MEATSTKAKNQGLRIFSEKPEATGEESAWIEDGGLEIRWHKFSKEFYYRVLEPERFELDWIKAARLNIGKRRGFHSLELAIQLDPTDTHIFQLSKSHKRLCQKIILLLRQNNIPVLKNIVSS